MAMKKVFSPRNLQILALGLVLGLAAPAAAQDMSSFYVTPKIMTSYQKAEMSDVNEKGSVFGLGVSLGTDLSYSSSLPIRVETEYIYHGNQTFTRGSDNHDISSHTIMGNAFLDIHTDTDFTPYVGGGLGVAYLNDHVTTLAEKTNYTKDKIWNFAWNAGGGVAWGLNESMALDLGYRYMDMGKTDGSRVGSNSTTTDLTAHEFSLGLRISGF
jgi:opacity protein-like surface antigen